MPPSSLPERLTGKGGASIVTVVMGLPGGMMAGGVLTQEWVGEAVLRGAAAAAAKSVLLLPESVQPPAARKMAVFTDGAGAGAVSEQFAVPPTPTKSTIVAETGHAPLRAVVLLTRATFSAVADMAIVPVTS